MPTNYPTASDLQAYFTAQGYGTLTNDEAGTLIAAGVSCWERLSRYKPYLASAGTKEFDAPLLQSNDGYRLNLEEHPVMRNVTITFKPRVGTERELVSGTDYNMLPLSAGIHEHPFEVARFRDHLGEGILEIEGQWGYATSIPQPVWDAIINWAVATKLGRLASAQSFSSGGQQVKKFKQGPIEIEYTAQAHSSVTMALKDMEELSERYA